MQTLGRTPIELNARPESVQISAVAGLRIHNELFLRSVRRRNEAEARSTLGAFRNRSVYLVAQTIIENETIGYLPRVLKIEAAGVAVDRSRTDVLAIGKVGRRYAPVVRKRTAREQAAERIRQRIANVNIVCPALGGNVYRRVSDATAEIIFPVWACSEIGGVSIQAEFASELPLVLAGSERKILRELKKIAEGRLHRSCRRIERLEQTVIKFQCRIGLIRRRKRRCRANDAEDRLEAESRRNGTHVGSGHIALTVYVTHAEAGIEHRLIGIRRRAGEIVGVHAEEQLRFIAKLVVEANGKLIGIRGNFCRSGIGMWTVCALREVRQRITRKHARDAGIHRHDQRIAGKCRGVASSALVGRRYRQHLRRPEHLAKSLVLTEVKGLPSPVVQMRQHYRAAIGKPKLIAAERRNASRIGW